MSARRLSLGLSVILLSVYTGIAWAEDGLVITDAMRTGHEEKKYKAKPLNKDCTCLAAEFDEVERYSPPMDREISGSCTTNGRFIRCSAEMSMESIYCPADCMSLRELPPPLSASQMEEWVSETEMAGRASAFQKFPHVRAALDTDFPGWVPIAILLPSPEAERPRTPKVQDITFYGPVKRGAGTTMVTGVIFRKESKGAPQWAFYDDESSKLIHVSSLPYSIDYDGYSHHPHLVVSGDFSRTPEDGFLWGMSAGLMDTGPCCGPYSLAQLSDGPHPMDAGKLSYEAAQGFFNTADPGKSSWKFYGNALSPERTAMIDGPANVHLLPMSRARTFDSLPDDASVRLVAEGGEENAWYAVTYEDRLGYVQKKNVHIPLMDRARDSFLRFKSKISGK